MTTDLLYAYVGNLEKSYDDAGVLHVKGLATDASLDLDGQRCDPEWLKSAMAGWLEWGNIREMHGPNAVGTSATMEQKGTGYVIDAAIIDPLAAKKVESGVYKGFSIGIKNYGLDKSAQALAMAPNGIINKGDIIEISVVDRPANPNAKFEEFSLGKMVKGKVVSSNGIAKVDAPVALEVVAEGVPCKTCSGFGKVKNEGGTTDDFHECPTCHGSGTGGIDIRPSTDGGPNEDGAVDLELSAKPDPDCKTCDGTGKIKEGHVDCPDCVQGKAAELTDYFGWLPDEQKMFSDQVKSAMAELVKTNYSDDDRKAMARTGQAMPGGGFPIRTVTDLKNAIQEIGRAKNPAAAKAHIKARAKALGREDLIPDTWKFALLELSKSLKSLSVLKKAADDDSWVHNPTEIAAARDLIISFITAELKELSEGEPELWDISELLGVLGGLMSWWNSEAYGGETSSPYDQGDNVDLTTLGVSPDLIKKAKDGTDEDRSALAADVLKALGVEDKIASEKSAREELAKQVVDLKGELEQVKTMAAPRGIAIRATQQQKAKAAQRETLLSEAKSLRDSAALFSEPATRNEFINKAIELESQANVIQDEEE